MGIAHPALANALTSKAQQLEHVIFTGFTHEPAEQLAQAPAHLSELPTRIFSDNGPLPSRFKMAYHIGTTKEKQNAPPSLALKADTTEILWELCPWGAVLGAQLFDPSCFPPMVPFPPHLT